MVAPTLTINAGTTINAGVTLNGFSGYSPSLTIASADFSSSSIYTGTGNSVNGTSGYTQVWPGDLVCPDYQLTSPSGGVASRINSFFTACGYDSNSAYAFNATFASYTSYLGSMSFDGSGGLTVPQSGAFNQGDGSWTVECWVYPTVDNSYTYFYGQDTVGFFELSYRVTSNAGSFNITQNGGSIGVESPSIFPINVWYHVAMVYDNDITGNIFLYVNGVSQGSQTAGGFTDSQNVTAIGSNGVGAYAWLGNISNLRVTKLAVYTGDFTPPDTLLTTTQLSGTNISAITGSQCQLLLAVKSSAGCKTDSSTNAFTLTPIPSQSTPVTWSSNSPDLTPLTVSSYSCIVRVGWTGSQFNMMTADPVDHTWQTSYPGGSASLLGTFSLPVTLTPYNPARQLGTNSDWC